MPELHDPTRESLSETVRALVKRHGGPTAVGEQVGAHRLTVNRWMKGDIGIDKLGLLAEKLEEPITVRFGPGHEETPPEPAWLEGLVREIRMNREAIREAMLGPDQPNDAALVEMVKNDLRPLFEGLAAQFQGEVRQLLAERFGETDED